MTFKGVVIDSFDKTAVHKIDPTIQFGPMCPRFGSNNTRGVNGEISHFDIPKFYDGINNRIKLVAYTGKGYGFHQEDGCVFIFSDDATDVVAIEEAFSDFDIMNISMGTCRCTDR